MEEYLESWNDGYSSFEDINEAVPVEICWTPLKRRSLSCLLQRGEDKVPVMSIRTSSSFLPTRYPIRIDCHAFRGTIASGWIGEKPSAFSLIFRVILRFVGVPFPYRPCDTLRHRNGDELVAVFTIRDAIDGSWRRWPAEIAVRDKVYHLRMEHVQGRWRYAYYGHKFLVSDENGDIATAVIDQVEGHGRIAVVRKIEGIEAVLAFLFLEARDVETHVPD